MQFGKVEVLNVATPAYVTSVRNYLESISNRILGNYIIWRLVKESIDFLSFEALNHYLEYERVLSGKNKDVPRWEKCLKSVAGLVDGYR